MFQKFFEKICGSDKYRFECERLESEKTKAEEQVRTLFAKKRNAAGEKRKLQQFAAEAKQYSDLIEEKVVIAREFYLFRLAKIEYEVQKLEKKIENLKVDEEEFGK